MKMHYNNYVGAGYVFSKSTETPQLWNGSNGLDIVPTNNYDVYAGNTTEESITVNKIIIKQLGDINKDNKINIADVIAVIRHVGVKVGNKYYLDEEKRFIADINQDGKINIADVIGIIRLISSKQK